MTFAQRWNRFARGVLKRFFEKLEKKLDPDFWADYFYRFTRRLENRRMRAFIQRTDFTKLDVSGYPVLYITTGTSRFQLLDMKFCREMLMFSVACLYHKKLPRVEVELCGGV